MRPRTRHPATAHLPRRRHTVTSSSRAPLLLLLASVLALLLYTRDSGSHPVVLQPRASRRTRRCVSVVFACSSTASFPNVSDVHFQQTCAVKWGEFSTTSLDDSRFSAVVSNTQWRFGSAYNLAVFQSTCDVLFIQPCETVNVPPHIDRIVDLVRKGRTFSVAWRATLPMVVSRSAFMAVSGFDERVQTESAAVWYMETYLKALGFEAQYLQTEPPSRQQHVTQRHEQLLMPFASQWHVENVSEYELQQSNMLRVVKQPLLLQQSLDQQIVQEAREYAISSVLHDEYHVPWLLIASMSAHQLSSLLHRLQTEYKALMMVHVAHGLGNRLRAFGAAKSFADATSRVLVVIWERDVHCGAHFDELFERDGLLVVNGIDVSWPFEQEHAADGAWMWFTLYNYMSAEGGEKDIPLKDEHAHIYYRGAYVPKVENATLLKRTNAVLRALRPVSQVAEKVDEISERLNGSIGVHIRHMDPQTELQGFSGSQLYGDSETQVIQYWRAASAPASFATEIQRIWEGARTSGTEVFVASDCGKCRDDLADALGESVWWMEGDGDGCEGGERGSECVVLATAEMWALARCERLLGSMWSSFSEVAGRLKGGVRYAGADFGRVGVDEWPPAVRAVAEKVWRQRSASAR